MTNKENGIPRRAGRALRSMGRKLARAYRGLEARHTSLAVAREAESRFREHQMRLACAYLTYHAFIALFALALLASALLGYVLKQDPALQRRLLNELYKVLPDMGDALKSALNTIVNNRNLVTVVSLVGLIWTGSKISLSLQTGFNMIQGTEKRTYWKRRSLALGVVFVIVALGIVFVGFGVLYSEAVSWIGRQAGFFWALASRLAGFAVAISLGFIVFLLIMKTVPREKPDNAVAVKSALLGSLAFFLTRVLFDFYFTSVAKTKLLYGIIGVVIGLLIWLFIIGAVIFYSGEVMNVMMDRKRLDADSVAPAEEETVR
jgi:YihY family inner membrane protein